MRFSDTMQTRITRSGYESFGLLLMSATSEPHP